MLASISHTSIKAYYMKMCPIYLRKSYALLCVVYDTSDTKSILGLPTIHYGSPGIGTKTVDLTRVTGEGRTSVKSMRKTN
jgi:hypothetical protein